MEAKICKKCKKVKPFSEFNKNNQYKDGLNYICKSCNSERCKNARARHKNENRNQDYSKEKLLWCTGCQQKKSSFYFHKCKSNTSGFASYCKPCCLVKFRKHRYGVTANALGDMIKQQDNKCAICGDNFEEKICVDHNHNSGVVRGLLCNGCNVGLGAFRDNADILGKAISYLESFCRSE